MSNQPIVLPQVLPTNEACKFINRSPQTLRKWACLDCAPMGIRPIRINRRLAWKVSDLKMLLDESKSSSNFKTSAKSIEE